MLPCTRLMADGSVQFRAGCWIIFFFFNFSSQLFKLEIEVDGIREVEHDRRCFNSGWAVGQTFTFKSFKFQVSSSSFKFKLQVEEKKLGCDIHNKQNSDHQ